MQDANKCWGADSSVNWFHYFCHIEIMLSRRNAPIRLFGPNLFFLPQNISGIIEISGFSKVKYRVFHNNINTTTTNVQVLHKYILKSNLIFVLLIKTKTKKDTKTETKKKTTIKTTTIRTSIIVQILCKHIFKNLIFVLLIKT